MSNDFYNPTGAPAQASQRSSGTLRSEFNTIAAGFDKLPTLTGNANEIVTVNAGETALTSTPVATVISKDVSGGVAGLTLFKLNLRNVADTFTSFLTNTATAARTWTMPDKDGTMATTADLLSTTSVRTSNTILGTADHGKTIICTTGGFTQTFTAAATLGDGWFVSYRNSGATPITLDPTENINGTTSVILNPGQSTRIACTGSVFYTLDSIIPAVVGTATRDMTLGTGNVAYTGLGGTPKDIIFFAGDPGVDRISWGFSTSGIHQAMSIDGASGVVGTSGNSIYVVNSGGAEGQRASIASFDADGFTLAWTKIGAATGTLTFKYLARF